MEPSTLNAIAIFYKLKGRYDKEGDKIKHKIISRTDINMAEKRDLYQTQIQKRKCVQCKKPVGTLFKVDNDRLVALCGAASASTSSTAASVSTAASASTAAVAAEPCKLNIQIIRGKVIQLPDYIEELRETHKTFIEAIMKIKYNLLFKFSTEAETITSFEKEKTGFDSNATLFDVNRSKLVEITNLLNKKQRIDITELQLFDLVHEIKEMVNDSVDSGNPQILSDAVTLYIEKILIVVKENHELKYSYQAIEKGVNDTSILVQKPYTIADIETVIGKKYKVESLSLNK
jgi:hypothetical protein